MSRANRRRSKRTSPPLFFSILNGLLLMFYVLLSVFLVITMLSYNVLSVYHLNLIIPVVLAVIAVVMLLMVVKGRGKVFTAIILLLLSLAIGAGLYVIKSGLDVSERMNATARVSQLEMSVLVLKESPIVDVSEIAELGAPVAKDNANIQSLLERIRQDKGLTVETLETSSYGEAYQKLRAGDASAMVMNSAHLELVTSEYPEFESSVKTIYTYTVEKQVESATKESVNDSDVFNVYISGIDTYGSISSVSRSDVNIIMTVNRKTHKILLTTTPRDSYVPIAGGGNNQADKLTHAGIYGVDASIGTLENLYGIDINHYARINFTSFLTLIDLVGGVDIYNDQAFTSKHGGFDFPVGNIHLNSEQALGFVRERYSLTNGDNDRAKNQQKVIAALVNKMASLNSVTRYNDIINGLGNSVQTDMQFGTLMNFANDQLASGKGYEITSQAVTGTGSTGMLQSYAMPDAKLYMISLDESSLNHAKAAIQQVMEGK